MEFSQRYISEASWLTDYIAWIDENRITDRDVLYVDNSLWRHAAWLRLCGYTVTGDDPRSLGMFISW